MTGNKGDWSEVYVLLKLIADGRMLRGDRELKPIAEESYRIVSLERNEAETGKTTYKIEGDSVVVSNAGGSVEKQRCELAEEAKRLLAVINSETGYFAVPATEELLAEMLTFSIKAQSLDKADLRVEIHDHRTFHAHTRGFSIKSQLGSPSTLLNASMQTRFRYHLADIGAEDVERINNICSRGSLIDRVRAIEEIDGAHIAKCEVLSDSFKRNLTMLDDALPEIMGRLLWFFYLNHESRIGRLLGCLEAENIRGYDFENNSVVYESKIRRMLASVALGMTPSREWDGHYDANGGYLIVLNNGEIISYHIFDKDEFEDYLFFNTKLDTPSTSRYGIGTIEQDENGGYHIDLGLQIRFCV